MKRGREDFTTEGTEIPIEMAQEAENGEMRGGIGD